MPAFPTLQKQIIHIMSHLAKTIKILFFSLGIIFAAMIALAFTSTPFHWWFHLGQNPDKETVITHPESIVMFGGAGMPSEDNLIRLYHTAALAKHFEAPVILVHPKDSICQAEMTRYLQQNGINNIQYMTDGSNTRSQAVELMKRYPEAAQNQLIVVTSPEHVKRTVKCLEKAGFTHVLGKAAFPATVDFDLTLQKHKLGGNKVIPSVENVKMRYTFFNYLKLEITCMREWIALAYYKVKGWI